MVNFLQRYINCNNVAKKNYFCGMRRLHFIVIYLGVVLIMPVFGQISGNILNDQGISLPGATILLLPDSIYTTSDTDGKFSFLALAPGEYTLQISYIGYRTQRVQARSGPKSAPLSIELAEESEVLTSVVVTAEHAKQEMTLSAEHISDQFLERNLHGTFAKSIEKLPGISAINVGVGIAKPVIRGLSFNRIIVNHQGVKQESQQWGADHGLEVDPFDIDWVEIIKGPASLQYGSDGLGGVINISPARLLPKNAVTGSILGVHKTNNEHWGGSAMIGLNVDDNFVSARYSHQDFGDYRVPADRFTYNSFVLPIYNNVLKNTAGTERNAHITAGMNRSWGITRMNFSHYALEAGLFSGAVGAPRSYALTDDGNSRDIDVPKQEVDHYKVSLNQTLIFGKDHLVFNLGYQKNLRREFSFPEFHSIPSSQIDPSNTLALELDLETISGNAHYERSLSNDWKHVYGFDVQWQRNAREGFEFLLPDFRTFRSGGYFLVEKLLRSGWIANAGLRLDYARNKTKFFRRFVWDSNENITDTLTAPPTDDGFFNWSASMGAGKSFLDGRWTLKANLGKSFRVPYPAETVSNGIHHGTFRHEVGAPDLESEHGYQLDLSAEWKLKRFSGAVSWYFNYFDNFIYLGPTFPARFSTLPEAGQIFQYRQDDAFYTGFELQWNWNFIPRLELQQAVDFVQNYNLTTGLALPFTPQPAIRTDLTFRTGAGKWIEEFYFTAGHQYHFAAKGTLRVDRSEVPTPGYQLWNIGMGLDINWHGQKMKLHAEVQNLANVFYLNHLSRYRIINVPEQGRNLVFSLKIPFQARLVRQAVE
jgi:iron complex outermembrane recepter protein